MGGAFASMQKQRQVEVASFKIFIYMFYKKFNKERVVMVKAIGKDDLYFWYFHELAL